MEQIGRVSRLSRYPVKSMLGEDVDRATITEKGMLGDRALGILDAATGKLASAKRPSMWGALLGLRAAFGGPVASGEPLPPVSITFPDGSVVSSDDPSMEERLAATVGRPVKLVSSYDEMIYFEEIWYGGLKDDATPYGPVIGEESGEQVIEVPASLAAPQGFFDAAPIHVVTTATLGRLSELAPASRFEPERFRPNLVVEVAGEDGFVENDWQDRSLAIGDVRLDVLMSVPRCVMTTLPQGDLPRDADVLRTITKHNKIGALAGEYPCVGIYTTVAREGDVRVGDLVGFA